MIGNDVIDLELARVESNWKRKGYLDKIFTKNEKLMILNSLNSDLMVWNLWSRKEAAYKIYNRKTGIHGFFPLQLECFDLNIVESTIFGKVIIKDCLFYTKTVIHSQFINTIAVEKKDDFEKIKKLNNRNNIFKINGIPSCFEKDKFISKPVSISHHGRFEQVISF